MSHPLTISLGEILWDVLPDGKVLGGAPANVAWHAAQLGADAHIVSAVGEDSLGQEILERLKAMRLDTSTIISLPDVPTSTVDATLDPGGNATYVIHENVAWDRLPVTGPVLDLAEKAKAINFGSLSQRNENGKLTTHAILDIVTPEAIKIFDINLRPPFVDKEVLHLGFQRATVVKMNHDELPAVAEMFQWTLKPENSMVQLLEAYPNVRHLLVTKGAEGAWWQTRERLLHQAPPAGGKVVDTIGAGDSVTAAVMLGLLKGWDEERILTAALEIASFVCSSRGGTPELPEGIRKKFL